MSGGVPATSHKLGAARFVDLATCGPQDFAAVDGPLRRLRERDGANVRSSGITLITLGCNVRRYVLQYSSTGRSADPSPSITRKVQTHQVLSTPTRTTPSGPRVTTGRYLEASDLPRVAAIMPRVCSRMGPHASRIRRRHNAPHQLTAIRESSTRWPATFLRRSI